jgi:ATP-dependent RNA helicase DeaD
LNPPPETGGFLVTDILTTTAQKGFQDLGLSKTILESLERLGYEVPTPIQSATIPPLLAGRDLFGQAQTGTGKTAAFALPLLMKLDLKRKVPQVLVLTPTRELAIQVAEAFQRYAAGFTDLHVAPIYGGQDIVVQLKKLKRGLHIVVGTPGRVMDHMRRGTLKIDHLACLVLDEADEMLHMGFIEDIEWILEKVPEECQMALFSATLPPRIRKIARTHLENPVEISIAQVKANIPMIRQRYWMVDGMHKMSAMTRILEVEEYDAILVFVRTKAQTTEVATRLESQGFAAAPLSGEMTQAKREETVNRFKSGKLDILVATDVAARGLDIDRISHVINYDIPHNVDAYTHRIGRTGRAGRSGEAILFVTPREKGLLFVLKKTLGATMEAMTLPTAKMAHALRVERFKRSISETLAGEGLDLYRELLETYGREQNLSMLDVAAALALMVHADKPLMVLRQHQETGNFVRDGQEQAAKPSARRESPAPSRKKERGEKTPSPASMSLNEREDRPIRMERYRIDVGRKDGVKAGEIVGIFSTATGLERRHVGQIEIADDVTFIELPEGMPPKLCRELKNLQMAGRSLNFTLARPRSHHHSKKKRR